MQEDQHEINLPNADRLLINLKQDSTHPQYATPANNLPDRPNCSDVVLMRSNFGQFENQWKECGNQIVDYNVIQKNFRRLDLNLRELKKIKIYTFAFQGDLPARAQIDLLKCLADHTRVKYLEIDYLQLVEETRTDLIFMSLQLLAIGAIQVVAANEQNDALTEIASLRLWLPALICFHSGELLLTTC